MVGDLYSEEALARELANIQSIAFPYEAFSSLTTWTPPLGEAADLENNCRVINQLTEPGTDSYSLEEMNDGATLTAASRANRVEVTGAAGRGQRQPRLRLNSTAGIYSHRPREPVVVNMASGGATGPRRTPWTTRDWATLTAEQRREVGVRVHVARGGREAGGRRWRRWRRRRCPTGARQDQNRLIRNPI